MPAAKSSKPGKTGKAPSSPHGTAAWLAVVRAYNLCDAVMTARLAAIGLRVGEHEVLATIATTPGITQQALAARCFVAKSGVSMLLTQMEARGWVRRDSDGADARVRRLTLTDDGMAMAQKCLAVQAEMVTAMVAPATRDELDAVADVMGRVATTLEGMRAELKG
ncbi:DNA-binding transcriptional regulator, MarR family [Variovorax sp. YR266]|jgi:DNA-binding MarR family transcriptional regulator|uniref:MarR family winged helix-turn-helix transcriptional regulator n=1 Tax=Variovorax sp. YR266 TaxID=1884386 RepID=UPI0008958E4D|nr:MarR family transcriptional regulator [Variovorax sp. YR266]SDZ52634.1 DNA-binding transcriptional regulator, MarR family [Variovorax sp. YR266]